MQATSLDELSDPTSQIQRVCRLLERWHLNPDGVLVGRVSSTDGCVIDPRPIIEDLGDVVPFLIEAGAVDIARRQVHDTVARLKGGLRHANPRRTRYAWALRSYEWTDLLWGLLSWVRFSGEQDVLAATRALVADWRSLFSLPGGRVAGYCVGRLGVPLPLATLPDVGMFPEILVEWAEIGDDPSAIAMARGILAGWLDDDIFLRFGLFPKLSPEAALGKLGGGLARRALSRQVRQMSQVRLFKDNTNLFASLLSVYRVTSDPWLLSAISRWCNAVRRHLQLPGGGIASEWSPSGVARGPDCANFQVIDLLVEAGSELQRDDLLSLAREVADYWLSLQGPTGLFPRAPELSVDLSDHQTDMTVALLKLSEASGERRYFDAAARCLSGIARYHYRASGLADSVNVETGQVVDGDSKTKFLALSIKAWVAYENHGKLLTDRALRLLLADR